jgi:O-antigen ligase
VPEIGPFVLLLLAAGAFYLAPWPLVYGPALLAFAFLTWLRPELALGVIVAFAPLFMVPKHIGSKQFAPSEIFLLIDAGVVYLYAISPAQRSLLRWRALLTSPLFPPLLLFLVAGSVSTLFAADQAEAFRAFREVIVEPALFFVLLLLQVSRSSQWRFLVLTLVLTGVVLGLVSLFQLATHQNLSIAPGSSIERVRAFYGSPDNLGLFYDRVVPMWLSITLLGLLKPSWRRASWLAGLVLLVTLFLTYSRGAWAAIAIGALLILVLVFRRGREVAVAVVVLAVAAGLIGGPKLVHALRAGHANTVQTRLDLWRSSVRMLRDHPLIGVGPDNFLHYYAPTRRQDLWQRICAPGLGYMEPGAGAEPCLSHPHNVVLDFWLGTGILGLLAFLWLQLSFWRMAAHAWRRWRDTPNGALALGAMAAMVAALAHGLVDNSYFLVDLAVVFWLLCGLISFLAQPDHADP